VQRSARRWRITAGGGVRLLSPGVEGGASD